MEERDGKRERDDPLYTCNYDVGEDASRLLMAHYLRAAYKQCT